MAIRHSEIAYVGSLGNYRDWVSVLSETGDCTEIVFQKERRFGIQRYQGDSTSLPEALTWKISTKLLRARMQSEHFWDQTSNRSDIKFGEVVCYSACKNYVNYSLGTIPFVYRSLCRRSKNRCKKYTKGLTAWNGNCCNLQNSIAQCLNSTFGKIHT